MAPIQNSSNRDPEAQILHLKKWHQDEAENDEQEEIFLDDGLSGLEAKIEAAEAELKAAELSAAAKKRKCMEEIDALKERKRLTTVTKKIAQRMTEARLMTLQILEHTEPMALFEDIGKMLGKKMVGSGPAGEGEVNDGETEDENDVGEVPDGVCFGSRRDGTET